MGQSIPASGSPWTGAEIDVVVAAYRRMLWMEHRGERYSKAEIVRGLRQRLATRSQASVERKLQNVSAVLDELGRSWIDGYKPLTHYQHDLRDAVVNSIGHDRRLAEASSNYSAAVLPARQLRPLAREDVLVPPPSRRGIGRARSSVNLTGGHIPALRDFQAKALGDAGEAWVVDLEREQLHRAGRGDLAARVQWVARDVGDGLGYDIASYGPDGGEHLIEVKTTNYGARTPFYITRWEVDFSAAHSSTYSLYRVHGFARDPRLYTLPGSIADMALLEPSVFLGLPL